MEHIHNFLTIPFDSTSVVEVSNWLTHAHYIHAIDYERHCVLVFNIPHKAIAQLIRLGLCDYDDFSFKNVRIRHGIMSNSSASSTGTSSRI